MEKMKVEQEKKKSFLAQEALKEKVKEKVLETLKREKIIHSCIIVNIIWLWYWKHENYDQSTQILTV